MTDDVAPEQIWAWPFNHGWRGGYYRERNGCPETDLGGSVYIRADLFNAQVQLENLRASAALADQFSDKIFWCARVLGPDEVHPTRSYAEAVKLADEINRVVLDHRRNGGDGPLAPACFAYAAPWPHTRESHAEALAEAEAKA